MGNDNDSDETWAAEMRLRGDVPLPEGVALPVGTLLHVHHHDAHDRSDTVLVGQIVKLCSCIRSVALY